MTLYNNDYKIIKKTNLNYFDPKLNSNKFYIAELHEYSKSVVLYITYGRQESKGTVFTKKYDDICEASKAYDNKINSKTKKGYVRVELATNNVGSSQVKSELNAWALGDIAEEVVIKESKLSKKIIQLVTRLYSEANQAITASLSGSKGVDISTSLGALGYNGINKGREILKEISEALDRNDLTIVEDKSVEYFRFVPRGLGNNIRDKKLWMISTKERVQKELETLELYEDSLRLLPAMTTLDIDEKYNALNCNIKTVSNKEIKEYIKHKVESTVARNHNYKLEVVNAYEINQKNAPKFDKTPGNIVNLFHGSRSANLVGIISSNLKLPKYLPNNIKTGAMFGPGIYLASESSKSFNYSSGYWGGGENKHETAFLFICETSLGEVYEIDSAKSFNKPPKGYDSVKGCRGKNLYNNEFIVYNENQVRIKYLVEVRKL